MNKQTNTITSVGYNWVQRSYSSFAVDYYGYWDTLKNFVGSIQSQIRFPGHMYVSQDFKEPYPSAVSTDLLVLAFIHLVEKYAYTIVSPFIKVNLGFEMILRDGSIVTCTCGKALSLFDKAGNLIPKSHVYHAIRKRVMEFGERYYDALINSIFINIYYETTGTTHSIQIDNDFDSSLISNIVDAMDTDVAFVDLPEGRSLKYKKSRVPTKVSVLRSKEPSERRSFIVGDIETIMIDNVHVPFAAGFLVVRPGEDLTSLHPSSLRIFYTEDYINSSFEDRSYNMFLEFLLKIEEAVSSSTGLRTIYFHNLAGFDGILILRRYVNRGSRFKVVPLLRNRVLYEIKVYVDGRFLIRFRDSYTLLPQSLQSLGKTLCPELGPKGEMPHGELIVSDLKDCQMRRKLIAYLEQDIRMLGGIMLKAQEINWSKYGIDVEDVMTVSSLALRIFRKQFFDEKSFTINIPNRNQDTFIRRGYYGGHVDVYKPYGENLYYYDVNSLYPFIMKTFPMPSGEPVWMNNLENTDLDDLFGFLEAYVVCPSNIEHPFLPYKNELNTLIFPTGKFIGVYFSEELKYARSVGYQVIPLRGYFFEKKESPFKRFITDLYDSRLEAKKRGDEPLNFVYKVLMNSLYGRFGMNPESLMTKICGKKEYEEHLKMDSFQSAEQISQDNYMVHYVVNSSFGDGNDWVAPKVSAVQLAAAITAYARIHMYPYISRPDCYYTDTDSIVLGNPLPDDIISSTVLGLFKLENKADKGIFLAPKSYMLQVKDKEDIIRHKGPAKSLITSEIFQRILEDPSIKEQFTVKSPFRINWKKLQIINKEMFITMGLPISSKREYVFDKNHILVNTKPVNIIDLRNQDANIIMKYELMEHKKRVGKKLL